MYAGILHCDQILICLGLSFLIMSDYFDRLTCCHGSSFFALALFSLSGLSWTWSVTAEVFGLNNLFVGALILVAVIFDNTRDQVHTLKVSMATPFSFSCKDFKCYNELRRVFNKSKKNVNHMDQNNDEHITFSSYQLYGNQ